MEEMAEIIRLGGIDKAAEDAYMTIVNEGFSLIALLEYPLDPADVEQVRKEDLRYDALVEQYGEYNLVKIQAPRSITDIYQVPYSVGTQAVLLHGGDSEPSPA